jgi:hypothetical protein
MKKVVSALVLLALMLLWSPTRILAHGQPQITVTPDIVAARGTITVKGMTMGANEEFKISLEGMNFRADLGSAQSDADENLTAQFTIPANAPAGDYQVKALSADGDATTADLTVTAAAGGTLTPPPGEAGEPSAASHELPRSRNPLQVVGLFAVVVSSAGVGLLLVRLK